MDELWDLVRSIPRGRVASYGSVGAALKHPMSGFLVGRRMAHCPEGVPWWRVVAKSGSLPIGKIDPYLEMNQRQILEREGVGFVGDLIDIEAHGWEP